MTRERLTVNQDNALRFQRATLVVRNLERALELYRDALGFSVEYVMGGENVEYSRQVFALGPDATVRLCTLNAPGQQRTLALVEAGGVALPRVVGPRRSAAVLRVADFDGVIRAAAALPGVTMVAEHPLHTHDGRLGREAGIVDFDGNLIVIYCITEV
jgi:catechol 2,3-dioxygenase-like lactoylglutathione lyase family enzyme